MTVRVYNKCGLGGAPSLAEALEHQDKYAVFHLDMENAYAPASLWTATQATAGTLKKNLMADAATLVDYGVLVADSNSTTQGQGINCQATDFPFITAAGKRIWCAIEAKVTDTIGGCQVFLGLAGTDTTLIASNALDYANAALIGFYADGTTQAANSGDLYFAVGNATAMEDIDAVVEMTEDTYFTCGFVLDQSNAWTGVDHNNQRTAALSTYAPAAGVTLKPTIVCQTNGSVDPIVTVRQFTVIAER